MTARDKQETGSHRECDGDDELTPIHGRIHCAAADEPENGEDDLQQIEIGNLIDTFAESPWPSPAAGRS